MAVRLMRARILPIAAATALAACSGASPHDRALMECQRRTPPWLTADCNAAAEARHGHR